MKKNVLRVLMQPEGDDTAEPVEVEVVAMLGDQMRAELEVKRRTDLGPQEVGINFVSAMAWAALAREGRTTLRLDEFVGRVYELERLGDEEAPDVDPTHPALSAGSVSPSLSTSPEPATTGGSTESTPGTTS